MVIRIVSVIGLLFGFLASVVYAAEEIQVLVDRTQVQENESFNVTFKAGRDVNGDPDFAPLEKDFQILNRSQSSSIQIINGKMSREISWNLDLMPKHIGDLQIPAIAFGSYRTLPKPIKVVKSATGSTAGNEPVFMEATVDSSEVYVQSQLQYTLRIYHSMPLRSPNLSQLSISDKDAVIEKSDDKQYEKNINGRQYQVYEQNYSIFPQSSGQLVIEPQVLDVQYIDYPRTIRTRRLTTERFRISVLPIPDQIKQKQLSYWLPAKELGLEEKWSDQVKQFNVGDPITRTLTIRAKGMLASAFPELATGVALEGVKQYPDQPVIENKFVGTEYESRREEKIAYIPSKPGQITLPGITIYWWNTKTKQVQVAKVAPRTITVVAPAGQAPTVQAAPQLVPDQGELQQPAQSPLPAAIKPPTPSSSIWFWVSCALLLSWLITLFLWWRSRRQLHVKPLAYTKPNTANSYEGLKQIKTACDQNNAKLVKDALLIWGQQVWPTQPPTSLGHIAQRVNGQFANELQSLNQALYHSGSTTWTGNGLWHCAQEFTEQYQQRSAQKSDAIKPLFRLAPTQTGQVLK